MLKESVGWMSEAVYYDSSVRRSITFQTRDSRQRRRKPNDNG